MTMHFMLVLTSGML